MSADLRVAVVARAVKPLHGLGGLERSVHDLVRHLAARGVAVTLIVPPPAPVVPHASEDPFASPLIHLRHVRYVTFPGANRRGTTILDRSTAYLAYGVRAGRLALSLVRAGEIDVVHGFGASALGYAMARANRRAPLVLNPQGLEEFGSTLARQPRVKRMAYLPLRTAVRRVAQAADCILATDASLAPTVQKHLRPRTEQLRTIPNGIDLVEAASLAGPADGRTIRQRRGIAPGEMVFVSAGRLERNKGFNVMAAALARLTGDGGPLAAAGWRWVLVGEGPYGREIARTVESMGLGHHVILAGRVDDHELHAWYEAASVFVHPTLYEGSSLVTLEAMAHRRPVVATRAGGLPDKVRPGETGWLVEPDDVGALSDALADATLRAAELPAMGAAGRQLVEREFAWPILATRTIELYRELLARPVRDR